MLVQFLVWPGTDRLWLLVLVVQLLQNKQGEKGTPGLARVPPSDD